MKRAIGRPLRATCRSIPPVLPCLRSADLLSAGTREDKVTIRLGLIGFGTIGRAVARAVEGGTAGDARVVAVLVRDLDRHRAEAGHYPWKLTNDPARFFAEEMDLVVEGAGHEAVHLYAVEALRRGMDFLTISTGAFADDALLAEIQEAAREAGRRVLIPSGAIGGLDAIAAGAVGGLEEVTIVTRKPPRAWKGTVGEQQVDLDGLTGPALLYSGPAREAAKLYPQNVNVQAALALAGIGMDRTRSEIYADPGVQYNTHDIAARGHFGEIRITIGNIPSEESPKTGRITAMSIVKAIRNLTAPLVIGL
jgi:aspartate dehydrogenase